ncbi:MAG: 50S ribosomal protein L21e [Candidatus Nanoarchaeia archaeon]|nr:50S ribosomal protein L21e [Candidatus Nanoarchaeia archaeon]
MVQRIGGFRRKTRHKLLKPRRSKGKISISNFFQNFKEGERVILKAEPAVQKGMYFPRFHGKSGIVTKKVGRCYQISIKDGKNIKQPVVHPVHLKKAKV